MRIAILQGAFLPIPAIQGGAVEKIWYRMGQEFASMGHDVTHIGRSHPTLLDREELNGVKYLRISGYDTPSSLTKLKYLDFLYSFRAVKLIPKDVDVIITNTFWSPLLLNKVHRQKNYIDVQRVPRGQMHIYLKWGSKILRGCSPAIYDAIKKEIPVRYHKQVSYVPNPVPFEVLDIPVQREKIILFVGRLHPEKGVDILIKAFSNLTTDTSHDWKLVIVGPFEIKDGGGGESYYNQLKSLVINSSIEFAGPIYNDFELKKYYSKASIFCYPAQEGSGDAAPVAPREAMAYGVVPVVSKLACFNDFITDGENGLCFDHQHINQVNYLTISLQKLINDNVSLNRLSKAAKQISHNYSSSAIAKLFLKDFENLNS